jgi:hypothetical protein
MGRAQLLQSSIAFSNRGHSLTHSGVAEPVCGGPGTHGAVSLRGSCVPGGFRVTQLAPKQSLVHHVVESSVLDWVEGVASADASPAVEAERVPWLRCSRCACRC